MNHHLDTVLTYTSLLALTLAFVVILCQDVDMTGRFMPLLNLDYTTIDCTTGE